ncbi:MAG TPA: protein kinase, partial [Planctomycetaceae bacterium]|nr:protein kinase [Planctomycetaceae bacterium]
MNELLNHSEQFSREIQQTIQPRALSDDQLQSLNEDWGQEASSHTNIQHTIKPQSEDTRPRGTGSSLVVHRRLVMRSHESGADQSDYQIQEAIGEGGIGTVYAAQQSSVTRTVALKVLKPEYASVDEHRQKFIAEAIVIGDLDHPNIVPIYDLAKNDSESLFYTMKRVFGTPWTDVIDTNSQGENIEILEKVCDAIAFAHSRGVIHRDLKPDNIMLGDFGEVLVMDWGIALVKPESPKYHTLRESGEGLGGTPAYMAPEMATGPIETITNKSDVYLLGALLYRFLTKHAPHRGRNVRDCVEQAARNIIQPTSRNDELVEIALRAMSTRPEDRYQDVAAFKEALKKYKSHSESILLSDKAAEDLALARKTSDYQIFSRAVFGFDESLLLWNENKNAIAGRIKAREDYALAAYEKEDFDLGLSLLDESEPHYAKLRTKLISAIEDRNTRASQLQRAKVMFRGVLAFSAAAIILFALKVWVDSKQLSKTNSELADKQLILDKNQEKLDENQKQLDANQNELDQQNKSLAVALSTSIISRQQSEIAKQKADIAVQKTSYEVYMGEIALAAEKIESNAFDEARQILKRYELSELKGWEWYRLWYLTTQQSLTDARTNQRLETVAVSHHGKWIAAGGDGGE